MAVSHGPIISQGQQRVKTSRPREPTALWTPYSGASSRRMLRLCRRPVLVTIEVTDPGGDSPTEDMFKLLIKVKGEVVLVEDKLGVLTKEELESRYHVRMERYIKDMMIELHTLQQMVDTMVLPAAFTAAMLLPRLLRRRPLLTPRPQLRRPQQ